MTSRRSQTLRQVFAALTSISIFAAHISSVHAQGFGNVSGASNKSALQLTNPAGLPSTSDSVGQLDSSLTLTPTIRQDGRSQDAALQRPTAQGDASQLEARPLKPLPPNEFQKFMLESTGKFLPLFGSDFFATTDGSFSSLSTVPVAADYRLGPGDELQIKGWGSVDVDVQAVVDRNGLIHIPRVGSVSLGGIRSSQAEQIVRAAIGKYYKDFQLSVTQGQLRGMTIYIVGQARQPGAYRMSGASTLVSALFASGGPNQNGSMRHIQVKRGERLVTELDLYDFLGKGDKSADVKLQDGDTIVIPSATGHVALTGKVAHAAVYEISDGQDDIESMLRLAGGLPIVADPKRAYLERIDPNQKPARSVESFPLDVKGMKKKLKSGDLLTVLPLTPEFANAITLRGNVEQPRRVPWREGLRIRDLIPDKSYLMSRASIQRRNSALLTDEDQRHIKEGLAKGMVKDDELLSRDAKDDVRETEESLATRIGRLIDEVNLEYAVVERIDSNNISVQLIPFNLGEALADEKSPENLQLQAGDIVTVFSINDVRVPQSKRQVYVRVEGEVHRPGVYQMNPGDGLLKLLDKAGGLTGDAYLFGAGFYREEVKQLQLRNLDQLVRRLEAQMQTRLSASAANVGNMPDAASFGQLRLQAETLAQTQALNRLRNLKPTGRIMLGLQPDDKVDALPPIKLESQDRLVIPIKPDFVHVLGSVNTESSLLWRKGRAVQYYLDQSGLTSGADKEELFIIRADGSVLSGGGGWMNGMTKALVQAGDLIVLPEKTDHESAWTAFTRNAKDITQIIYQFSLGAAAIKTLRE